MIVCEGYIFMMIKLVILLVVAFVLPTFLGKIITEIAGIGNEYKTSYLLGIITFLALFYLWIQPDVKNMQSLSDTAHHVMKCFEVLAAVTIVGFLVLVNKYKKKKHVIWKEILIVCVVSFLLAGVSVCVKPNVADYTKEMVNTMYMQDTLFNVDPLTGKELADLDAEEQDYLQEFAESPFSVLYAVMVFQTKIIPAKLVSIILPFLIFPFYVCIYLSWGEYLFQTDKGKQIFFEIVVWGLLVMGLLQKWDKIFDIFGNPWNGETLFFLGILPYSVLTFLKMEDCIVEKKYFCVLFIIANCFSAKLMYQYGIFVELFVSIVFLIIVSLRRWYHNGNSYTTA